MRFTYDALSFNQKEMGLFTYIHRFVGVLLLNTVLYQRPQCVNFLAPLTNHTPSTWHLCHSNL